MIKEQTNLDFLIQVKANCGKLFKHIAQFTQNNIPSDTNETQQTKRGRIDNRQVMLFKSDESTPKEWKYITRFIKVRRWGFRDGKEYDKTHFYILSLPLDSAKTVAEGILGHWRIENASHRYRDVNFGEDTMSITNHIAASVIALFNVVTINLMRFLDREPNKDNIEYFKNNVNELLVLCQNIQFS